MNLSSQNVDALVSRIDLEGDSPLIDLSNVTFFTPFGLLYLGMFIRYYSSLGYAFEVTLPIDAKAREYIARMQFWERFSFSEETIRSENRLRQPHTTSWNDIMDIENRQYIGEDIADRLLEVLRDEVVQINHNLAAEMVSELVDNFAQHSNRTLAACLIQYYPNRGTFSIAIGDCGIGIRASLAMNPEHSDIAEHSHMSAAATAFRPLTSRKSEGGMGLTQVAQGVRDSGGSLFLSTGDGFLSQNVQKRSIGHQKFDLPGVIVQLTFPERR